jgi:hypothetical protein
VGDEDAAAHTGNVATMTIVGRSSTVTIRPVVVSVVRTTTAVHEARWLATG